MGAAAAWWWQLSLLNFIVAAVLGYVLGAIGAALVMGAYWVRNRLVLADIETDRMLVSRTADGKTAYRIWLRALFANTADQVLDIHCEVVSLVLQGRAADTEKEITARLFLFNRVKTIRLPPVDGLVEGEASGHLHVRVSYGQRGHRMFTNEWRCALEGDIVTDADGRPDLRLTYAIDDVS
jgi:hypothetical protein